MWKICIDNPFSNCRRIYPIQQKRVRRLIDHYSGYPCVKRMIVFGSSVTEKCHIGSDVDLYLEKTEDQKIKMPYLDFPCDLWTNYTVDERLREEIMKTGVIVYERL